MAAKSRLRDEGRSFTSKTADVVAASRAMIDKTRNDAATMDAQLRDGTFDLVSKSLDLLASLRDR